VDLYSALFVAPHSQGTAIWTTQFYLQITPYLPLPCKCSRDGATTDCSGRRLIAAYYVPIIRLALQRSSATVVL